MGKLIIKLTNILTTRFLYKPPDNWWYQKFRQEVQDIELSALPATIMNNKTENGWKPFAGMESPSTYATKENEPPALERRTSRDMRCLPIPEPSLGRGISLAHDSTWNLPAEALTPTSPIARNSNPETETVVSALSNTEIDQAVKELDLVAERVQTLQTLPNVCVMERPRGKSRRITPRRILCTPVESVHLRNSTFVNAPLSQLYIGIGDPLEPERQELRAKRAQMRTGSRPPTSGGMDTTEYPM